MNSNDLVLEEEIRRLLNYAGKVNVLLRDRKAGNLEDALTIIELAAKNGRRRLREICVSA